MIRQYNSRVIDGILRVTTQHLEELLRMIDCRNREMAIYEYPLCVNVGTYRVPPICTLKLVRRYGVHVHVLRSKYV